MRLILRSHDGQTENNENENQCQLKTQNRRKLEAIRRQQRQCGGNNSPPRPYFFSLLSTLWGPGRHQEPGRRKARSRNSFPALNAAAVVQALPAVQRILRKRELAILRQGKSKDSAGEIIPPRAPLIRLRRAFAAGRESIFEKAGKTKRRKVRKPRQAFFGLQTQCRRARLHPPAAGRPMFPLRGNIGEIGKDFQIFERMWCRPLLREKRVLVFGLFSPGKCVVSARSAAGNFRLQRRHFNALGPRAAFEWPGRRKARTLCLL